MYIVLAIVFGHSVSKVTIPGSIAGRISVPAVPFSLLKWRMDSELQLFLQARVVQSWVRIRLYKSPFFFLVGYAILARDFVARSVAA